MKIPHISKWAAAGIAAGILLVTAAVLIGTRFHKTDPECARNVARLKELEKTDITQTEAELAALEQSEKQEKSAATQEEIAAGTSLLSDVELKQAFAGSAILGDSITSSIAEYGFLGTDVVIAKMGLSIDEADEQIETAIGLSPSHIFLAFGANDLEEFGADSGAFKAAYQKQVQKLKDALPDVPIYINCILPLTEDAIAATPDLGYYPQYNDALKALCEEMGCTYLDDSFIVEADPSLYEPDGEHVVADYYPKWLTYMAETAGL